MKLLTKILIVVAASAATAVQAATINYTNGVTNTSNASGPSWVAGSNMFLNITSGSGSGSTQDGFAFFDVDHDITLLTWTFGPMSLYQGAGTETLSPGAATPGFEDYRYTGIPTNLSFSYNGTLWAEGYVSQFIVEVDNNADVAATGEGWATLTSATVAGQDFFDAVTALSGGSNAMRFVASSFTPVVPFDPGQFASAGFIEIVPIPEPSTVVTAFGALALVAGACLRRGRGDRRG